MVDVGNPRSNFLSIGVGSNMVNHAQDFMAVKKYEILQFSLIPTPGLDSGHFESVNAGAGCVSVLFLILTPIFEK